MRLIGAGGGSISGTAILINLLGGVALLLWGMRMVQVGLTQAFGADLRHMIGLSLRNRGLAWLTGLGVTAVLQSSTATAMLTVSFAREGLVDTAPGLAVMLGAGVGTSLVAQVLAFDLSWLAPLLILAGVLGYFTRRHSKQENLSQAIVGLGLMLLALHQIEALSQPLRDSLVLRELLDAASGPLLLVLLGALITWASHSSLAGVLLVISLAGAGVVSVPVGLALVLGANLGNAMPPLMATLGSAPEARRIPLGNLLSRLTGVVLVLLLLPQLAPWMQRLGGDPGRLMAHFHTAFNLALSIVLIGLTTPLARLLTRLLPERPASDYAEQPRYLDRAALDTPSAALVYAEREVLRMGDTVEKMLNGTLEVLRTDDDGKRREVEALDNVVDRLHQGIKFYLMEIRRETMNDKENRRAAEILSFTINLEHVGDIIDKNLMELAAKKIRYHLHFSDEGFQEIATLHQRLVENMKLAFVVFMSQDVEMARKLLVEKSTFRAQEHAAAESHLARLRGRRVESIDTSSIHLDVLNELRRINGHIVSVAYPILEERGELTPTRLKDIPDAAD